MRIITIFTLCMIVSCSKAPDYSIATVANDIEPVNEEPVQQPKNQDAAVTQSRQTAITRAVSKASPAIVSITVTEVVAGRRGNQFDPFFSFFMGPIKQEINSIGSGFIISEDGLVVTNEHVAPANAKKIVVATSDGTQYDAEIVGADAITDLSLLRIKNVEDKLPFIEFSNSEKVIVGEWAIAMGNPFGLFDAGEPSVTVGVVSATKRDFRPDAQNAKNYLEMIQTDAAINRGNSGGPLLDSNGNVIGVNTFIFTGGTNGFVGLGFAIPSNRVKKIVALLKENGEVPLGFDMGMDFTEMTWALVQQYGLPGIQGLLVTQVNRDGPAYDSGLLPGDIILKIGNEKIGSEKHARAVLREYSQGEDLQIEFYRQNSVYEASIPLKKSVKGN